MESHFEAEWGNSDGTSEEEDIGEENAIEEEPEFVDALYCFACDKSFKSDKA